MRISVLPAIVLLTTGPSWSGETTTPTPTPASATAATSVAADSSATSATSTVATAAPPTARRGCLGAGNGYLRARIRGTLTLDVNLHDAELECEGGPRPDGSGIRVSFAGPVRSDGRRLRMVFGVAKAAEGAAGRELPTNLTVIFEGEQRMFATRGNDKCTVDELTQERVGALDRPARSYRIIARGFCIAPVQALSGAQTILVNSFDFAGRVTFEDPAASNPGAPPRGN